MLSETPVHAATPSRRPCAVPDGVQVSGIPEAKTNAPLPFVWSFDAVDITTLNPTMVVISREPDGRWYVTFAVDTDNLEPLDVTGHEIGVDLGVRTSP